MNNELYALVNELNFKKNTLDTQTDSIVEEIKNWCIGEHDRILNEFKNLKKFVSENISLFYKNTEHTYYSDRCYYSWEGLTIKLDKDNVVKSVGLTDKYSYNNGFGFSWSKLINSSHHYDHYRFFDETEMNNKNVTYWTDYKMWLAVWNEYLCETTKRIKAYLGTLIAEQDTRFNEMKNACDEIYQDNLKTVEIKISVREG